MWIARSLALALSVGFAGSVAASDDATIVAALARYRTMAAEDAAEIPASGPSLRLGSRHASVPLLRARLVATGDLAPQAAGSPASTIVAAAMIRGLRRFQDRHGLGADGVLGPATRRALAVPLGVRAAQLERAAASAARPAPARRWIRVNVPRFWLEVIDGDDVVLEMPVIVGRPSRPTPTMDSTISWIQLNPPWTVPPLLAYEDMLPKIRRDPSYLTSRRIEILDGWRPDARRIDPATIDWATIDAGIRDLTLRQRPGPGNALGQVLFYMENGHDVFLHDTPSRNLFREARRDFSSGCIRVADARGLVREILRGTEAWPSARVDAAIRSGETTSVEVRAPMPIRIVYEPAWVDAAGVVHFRDDIYDLMDDARAVGTVARAAP